MRRLTVASVGAALLFAGVSASAAPAGAPRAAFLKPRLYPLPYQAVEQCRLARRIGVCPRVLPRAWLATWRDRVYATAPPLLSAVRYPVTRNGTARLVGLSFGYSAPWEPGSGPGWRAHLWQNRPCCFLHFELYGSLGGRPPIPGTARPARVGGHTGLFARAGGFGLNCPGNSGAFFCNHDRFFWRERGRWHVATLHTFGVGTRPLLDRIVRELRPVDRLRPPAPHLFGSIRVGGSPNAVAAGTSFVWAMGSDRRGGYLARIPRGTSVVTARLRLPVGSERACGLAITHGSLYVAANPDGLLRVGATRGRLERRLRVPQPGCVAEGGRAVWATSPTRGAVYRVDRDDDVRRVASLPYPIGIAYGLGAAWAVGPRGVLARLDGRTGRVVARWRVPARPEYVAVAGGFVWLSSNDGRVRRLDPATGRIRSIRVGGGRTTVSAGLGYVWAAPITPAGAPGRLTPIDPKSGRRGRAIRVGSAPLGTAAGSDALWVAAFGSGTVARITR